MSFMWVYGSTFGQKHFVILLEFSFGEIREYFKNGQSPASISFIFDFFKQTLQFLQQ